MKLRVAAFVLATLVGCARGEQPAPGASHPVASAAPLLSAPLPQPSSPAPAADAAPQVSASSEPLPSASSAEPAPVSVGNRDGLRGLVAASKDVDGVELLRWEPAAKAEPLSAADRLRLLQLIRGGVLTATSTLTHPPWPAAFLFHTRSHGTYAATLVGHSTLRLDAGREGGHFEGAAARWNSSPPPEMALNDEAGWLWSYFESRLGPTREKEYLMPKAPPYLELPHKP